MKTYEYKILQSTGGLPNEENLNDLGQEGWELTYMIEKAGDLYVYLKRETQADAVN